MIRNLDMTTLRSFVAVADCGGVTRAAGMLNLTQSAVSMQLKRLEENLDVQLLDRRGRSLALTATGEKLLGYARKMLALNDEAWSYISSSGHQGEIVLGVPTDIVDPAIPDVLRQFNTAFPRMRVKLMTDNSVALKKAFAKGDSSMIVTTEKGCDAEARTIAKLPMVWVGAQGGAAWTCRPLNVVMGRACLFRSEASRKLNDAGMDWDLVLEASSHREMDATVSADLAVQVLLQGTQSPRLEIIDHKGTLPELSEWNINLYRPKGVVDPVLDQLERMLTQAFRGLSQNQSRLVNLDYDLTG